MATALDLDYAAKARRTSSSSHANTFDPSSRPQNPDRIRCTKCMMWHHKDGPCRKADPRRGGGAPRANRPRVMEADFQPADDELANAEDCCVEEQHLGDGGSACSDDGLDF